MALSEAEFENRVTYHPPSKKGVERHDEIRHAILSAIMTIDDVCPDGRETSLAITKLEEAKFWASAAVARNPETR